MPENESRLVESARRGRESAFLQIYHSHRAAVFGFAWRLTGSTACAEDVSQECFMALLSGAAFDAARGSLRFYLLGIARNLAMKRLRLDGREADDPPDETAPGDALEALLEVERSAAVERAIAALPPLQKEALVLFEYEELSLEEIAQIAGVEVGAVKARLHRARETLRRRLAPLINACPERSCH